MQPIVEIFALCKKVERSRDGINLLGIFNSLYFEGFPAVHNFYSFVAINTEGVGPDDSWQFKLIIKKLESGLIIAEGDWQSIEISQNAGGTNITTEMNIQFLTAGSYVMKFLLKNTGAENPVEVDSTQKKLNVVNLSTNLQNETSIIPSTTQS